MKRMIWLAAIFLSILTAQERVGNQIFRIPQDWTRSEMNGSTILSPSAEPKNFVVIMLSGRALNGDFRETFDRDVKGLNGTQRVTTRVKYRRAIRQKAWTSWPPQSSFRMRIESRRRDIIWPRA